MTWRIEHGDWIDVLREMPDESVQMCCTSPPYWGLRDYGVPGQLGLERTPEEYVAKMVEGFREVRRVLRSDGTLWLNLGDSYAANYRYGGLDGISDKQLSNAGTTAFQKPQETPHPYKPKDLCGIPWMVAFALRAPYYTGRVKDERDRVWLAAMLDAEGCITASQYETGDRLKSNIYVSITNASVPIIDKCERLFPQDMKHVYEKGGIVNRKVYRWDVERIENKSLFIREIYPYLVAKRKQAILGYTFVELQRGLASKKNGYLAEQQEKRTWLVRALSRLNQGEHVDIPDWAVEPTDLYEPGFYLRQDCIWSKPNPMPESVRDRCTKAHEYIFLMSKSERYYYDSDAIAELTVWAEDDPRQSDPEYSAPRTDRGFPGQPSKSCGILKAKTVDGEIRRNKRSVWTVTTKPFSEAHFATFPPEIPETCIKAGSREGDTILDPFNGAGTTGLVATRLMRNYIGIELNQAYIAMAQNRIEQDAPLFNMQSEPAATEPC